MNKSDMIIRVANYTKMTQKDVGAALDGFLTVMTNALEQGERVQLTGFGRFEVKTRKPRTTKNPRTGKKVEIEEALVPHFKAGRKLKDTINHD